MTKVTAERPWTKVTVPPVDPIESADYHSAGRFTGYKTPYPLSEEDFLVSAQGADNQFRLYLMDVYGNRELIYEGVYNILHAIPVRSRQAPAQLPDRVVWPGTGKDRKPVRCFGLPAPVRARAAGKIAAAPRIAPVPLSEVTADDSPPGRLNVRHGRAPG